MRGCPYAACSTVCLLGSCSSLLATMLQRLVFFWAVIILGSTDHDNVLHYRTKNGWQGPPAALFTTEYDNTLHLYYNKPYDDKEMVEENVHLKWSHVSSKDGITWIDEDSSLLSLSASNVSYEQGGIIENIHPQLELQQRPEYIVVYKRKQDSVSVIGSRFTRDGRSSTHNGNFDTKFMVSGVDAFTNGNEMYLALLPINECNVEFHRITGEKRSTTFVTEAAGSFRYLKLPSGSRCSSIQVHKFNEAWLIFMTHTIRTLTTSRTIYWYGTFNSNDKTLIFTPHDGYKVLDFGHDAQDFKFAKFHGNLIAIGWNANRFYQNRHPNFEYKNSLTIPRFISKYKNGMVIQQPLDFKSKAIISDIPFGKDDVDLSAKRCSTSVDLTRHSKTDGAFIFDLEFGNDGDFKNAGYTIEFMTGNKDFQVLSVLFNRKLSADIDKFKLSVDRSKTSAAWDTSHTIAEATVGTRIVVNPHRTKIILDKSTVEVFGIDGRLVLTESYILEKGPFTKMCINRLGDKQVKLTKNSSYNKYRSIWSSKGPIMGSSKALSKKMLIGVLIGLASVALQV